jgi:hypothetical protein
MHIPKSAGVTLRVLVSQRIGSDEVYEVRAPAQIMNGLPPSVHQRFVIGHFGYNFIEKLPEPMDTITFLRDPIDRVLSHYCYWRKLDLDQPGPTLAKSLDLIGFLSCGHPAVRCQIDNMQTWQLAASYHPPSRQKLSALSDEKLLELALQHLDNFTFVGFTETFDNSFRELCSLYGWTAPQNTPAVNKSDDRKTAAHLSKAELAAISGLTHLDAQLYRIAANKLNAFTGLNRGG